MSIARISSLTVRYGAKTAVNNLSVEVPDGCVGLLGPNGAGKTTLLKTLLGFLIPTEGSGEVLGMNIATQGLAIRQRIGLMPEMDCHIPGMNAVSFVALCGELCGMPAKNAISRAHEVLEYCGLGEARYRNAETYSTGMKQRLKLAQALVHGPKLIFLDEPTNGLDPAGRDEMLELIRDISHGKGVNVIVSSHLLPDIERTCDGVIVMRSGRVVQQGTIAELRSMEEIQVDVELRDPVPAFAERLAALGAKPIREQGSSYRFAFPATLGNLGQTLFTVAKETQAQVRGFRPAQRSLEDIFLEAIE